MEEKTHTITCRLDEADFKKLTEEASILDVNASDFLRLIIRLPIEVKTDIGTERYVVIDPLTLASLWMDARRQGYLLNQAVKALNTVAFKVRHGSEINCTLRNLLIEATVALEHLEADHADIKKGIEELMEQREVFLDRYRKKPKHRRKRQSSLAAPTTGNHKIKSV